jgi:hypothetical protein
VTAGNRHRHRHRFLSLDINRACGRTTVFGGARLTLSNQQRKPSLKLGTSDEFGTVILLLSNKGVQPVGSQCLTQG